MLKEKNILKDKSKISIIQNGIFYMLFVLLPFAVIPMPWDWMDRGISILVLFVSSLLIFLELLKIFTSGKFSIFKSGIDTGIFLLFISLLVSLIFSVDSGISFWGVDISLSSGFVTISSIILLSFVMRSFIDTTEEIIKVLIYFSLGIFVINILSILSFLGIEFLNFLPAYSQVFTYGLPWTLSSSILLLVNGVSVFSTIGLIVWSKEKKSRKLSALSISLLIVNILAILIYSINQGSAIVFLLMVLLACMLFLAFKNIRFRRSKTNGIRIWIILPLLSFVLFFFVLRITSIKEYILDNFNLLTQVSLGSDLSWKVVSSGITSNLLRGIIGFGENTFVMIYNLYKPITNDILAFNSTNFYFSSSEVLTNLSEGGLIWFASWLYLGYLIGKEVLVETGNLKRIGSNENTFLSLSLSFSVVFLYISSFFSHFGILVKLVFLIFISLWIVGKNLSKIKIPEKFILKISAMETDFLNSRKILSMSNAMLLLSIIMFLFLLGVLSRITVSDIYIASAEYQIQNKSEMENASFQDRLEFLSDVIEKYSKAEEFFEENSLVNRKLSLLNLEIVSLYSDKYIKTVDENAKEDIAELISTYRKESIKQEQKAVDRNPSVYDNWKNSANVYMGFVSTGFTDYASDALNSLSNASDLNPGNYELYYNAAQIYLVKEDTDSALSSLLQALEINPLHVPSLLLTGQINYDLGKEDVYLSYLEAAKTIMEEYNQTDTDTYQAVVQEIEDLSNEE